MTKLTSDKGAVYVQPNGAGYVPKFVVGPNARGSLGAYSGGGISVESLFAFDRPIGSRITANPARYTFQIMADSQTTSALRALARNVRCIPNVLAFAGCTPQDVDQFQLLRIFVDAAVTGNGVNGNLIEGVSGESVDLMDQVDFDSLTMIEALPLAHADLSGAVINADLNDVIPVGSPSCPDACGPGTSGDEQFIAVGGAISPATIPNILYTADGGNTWTIQTIAAIANGEAEAVAVAGTRVIVAASGTNAGVFVAPLDAVKAGTATFVLATGITAGHVYNDVIALDPTTVIAVGASGRIAVSTDGGYSFTLLTSGVATALNSVSAGTDKSTVWVGGATGTLLRVRNLRTVQAITDPTGGAGINVVSVPLDRTGEVYVGTDDGAIFVSKNAQDATPSFTELSFDKPSGGGVINAIEFAEARQAIMFVLQADSGGDTRVLVDYTGGAAGKWMTSVGTYTSPGNSGINAIAPTSANFALTVGPIDSAAGFIGVVSS